MDACKSKPLDLPTTRKVIRALIGKNKSNVSRRERIIKAFMKEDNKKFGDQWLNLIHFYKLN